MEDGGEEDVGLMPGLRIPRRAPECAEPFGCFRLGLLVLGRATEMTSLFGV